MDVHEALSNNPTLRSLTQCRHLIIWFSTDGALWLDQKQDRVNARLIFDAMGAEDEWRAKQRRMVFGYSINMTTAVALGTLRNLSGKRQ